MEQSDQWAMILTTLAKRYLSEQWVSD